MAKEINWAKEKFLKWMNLFLEIIDIAKAKF